MRVLLYNGPKIKKNAQGVHGTGHAAPGAFAPNGHGDSDDEEAVSHPQRL